MIDYEKDSLLFNYARYMHDGLNDEQAQIASEILKGDDVLITGGAGTGKTYLLKEVALMLKKRYINVAVVAFTAQAALEAEGTTINKFFKFPPEAFLTKGAKPKPLQRVSECLYRTDFLIIDEISMIRADLMDAILMSVEKAERKRGKRIQLILFGDFYQLPPVPVTDEDEVELLNKYYGNERLYRYAFMAKYWKSRGFRLLELKTIVRQDDVEFIKNLNKIRIGDASACGWFNKFASKEEDTTAPYFFPLNADVDLANHQELDRLEGRTYIIKPFRKSLTVTEDYEDEEEMQLLTLKLKEGARVIAQKNMKDLSVCNGMLGTVVSVNRRVLWKSNVGYSVTVKFDDLINPVEMYPIKYISVRYTFCDSHLIPIETEYEQIPLRLGYAMTIHKGQGKTCQKANINPHCMTPGQLYVALSRVTDIDGLHILKEIREKDVIASRDVQEFMQHANNASHVFSWDRRDDDPKKTRGRKIIYENGCTRMHVPKDLQELVRLMIRMVAKGTMDCSKISEIQNGLLQCSDDE